MSNTQNTVAITVEVPNETSAIEFSGASTEFVEMTVESVSLVPLLDSIFNQLDDNQIYDILDRCWDSCPHAVSSFMNEIHEA